jgi:hypothetical protein
MRLFLMAAVIGGLLGVIAVGVASSVHGAGTSVGALHGTGDHTIVGGSLRSSQPEVKAFANDGRLMVGEDHRALPAQQDDEGGGGGGPTLATLLVVGAGVVGAAVFLWRRLGGK